MNIINSGAFLRTSREFPYDAEKLNLQINKSWIDIANAVNQRINGTYLINGAAVTGEEWFFNENKKQQSLRKLYKFTTSGNIPHNIFSTISMVSPRSYGTYLSTNGNWYGVIYSSNTVAIANLVTFYVTPSVGTTSGNIVILAGAGAPAISTGLIDLEWISDP